MSSELNDQLNNLYQLANTYSDSIPQDLAKKIVTYADILRVVGVIVAQCTYKLKKIEAEKKRTYASAVLSELGTIKEKEARAELKINKLRREEAFAESELIKWKNVYDSTKELINAHKKELDVLLIEWGLKSNGT